MRVEAAIVLTGSGSGGPGAVSLLRVAHTRFEALGSDAWCRRIEGMLRRMGERAPSRRGQAGEAGLTARELEVLGLLAEGLTNRAIADRLVLSQNTVIRHVANIFSKLGVKNRAAAATAAAERNLLVDAAGPRRDGDRSI